MFSSTIAALKPALSLIPITRMTVIDRRDEDRGQVEPGHALSGPSASVTVFRRSSPCLDVVIPGRRGQPRVEANVQHVAQERVEVVRPAGGDDARADRIFEDQVPADDPGDQLAQVA